MVISMMQKLAHNKIQGFDFDLSIALSESHKFSKLEINGDPVFIEDVDVAQYIRAVLMSETVLDFELAIRDTWTEEQVKGVLNKYF